MKVSNIFSSIQGEGKYTGYPTTFIRTDIACPFTCKYCDEKLGKQGKKMTLDSILSKVNKLGNRYVCITGGEPLLQEETLSLVYELLSYSYIVSIETSGLVPIEECTYNRSYTYVMDLKCPCSGEETHNCLSNLKLLKDKDELKCVVKNKEDIDFIIKTLKKHPTKASIILSPVNCDEDATNLIIKTLQEHKIKGKLGIQLHKVLGIK